MSRLRKIAEEIKVYTYTKQRHKWEEKGNLKSWWWKHAVDCTVRKQQNKTIKHAAVCCPRITSARQCIDKNSLLKRKEKNRKVPTHISYVIQQHILYILYTIEMCTVYLKLENSPTVSKASKRSKKEGETNKNKLKRRRQTTITQQKQNKGKQSSLFFTNTQQGRNAKLNSNNNKNERATVPGTDFERKSFSLMPGELRARRLWNIVTGNRQVSIQAEHGPSVGSNNSPSALFLSTFLPTHTNTFNMRASNLFLILFFFSKSFLVCVSHLTSTLMTPMSVLTL